MVKLTFIYMNNIYDKIINDLNSLINNELNLYVSLLQIDINQLYFIYNGKIL